MFQAGAVTECAAALLSFRYPSTLTLTDHLFCVELGAYALLF